MGKYALYDGTTLKYSLPDTCAFNKPGIKYDWQIEQVEGTSDHLIAGSGAMRSVTAELVIEVHGTDPADSAQQLNDIRDALLASNRLYEGSSEWWELEVVLEESPERREYGNLVRAVTFTVQLLKQLAQHSGGERRIPLGTTEV